MRGLGVAVAQSKQWAVDQLIVVCKKLQQNLLSYSPLILAPTTDYNQTNVGERCPWCWVEAPSRGLGVAAPKAKQSAIAQLIGVC